MLGTCVFALTITYPDDTSNVQATASTITTRMTRTPPPSQPSSTQMTK